MNIIENPEIPPAKGHYSPCVEHNGVLYISGQLPVFPESGIIPEGIDAQTRLVLEKTDVILNAAGSSRNKVIQMRIYVADITLWDQVNQVYSRFFGDHKPVRCVVPVGPLHYGCLIEAEAIAAS